MHKMNLGEYVSSCQWFSLSKWDFVTFFYSFYYCQYFFCNERESLFVKNKKRKLTKETILKTTLKTLLVVFPFSVPSLAIQSAPPFSLQQQQQKKNRKGQLTRL